MLELPGYIVFWLFFVEMVSFMATTLIIAWILVKRRPNPRKIATFECGQDPPAVGDWRGLQGGVKYFSYATIFFALDAFVWVYYAGAISFLSFKGALLPMLFYLVIVSPAIFYFLKALKELVEYVS